MTIPRDSLIALLDAHVPADETERADLERMRTFARDLEQPFSRSQLGASFTGSALVVDPKTERICLIYHKKFDRWLQPGGHAEEKDEGDMARTALREAEEEIGIPMKLHSPSELLGIDIHTIPARGDEPEHLHLDMRFLVLAKEEDQLKANLNEVEKAKWFSWEEATAKISEPVMKRLIEKARRIVESTPLAHF